MTKKNKINYFEIKPETSLSDYVKCFWQYENLTKDAQRFSILPDGCFDLIVELIDGKLNNIFITGIWTNQVEIDVESKTKQFGIRFKLLSSEYILQQRISSIVDNHLILPNNYWNINKYPLDTFIDFASRLSIKMLSEIGSSKGIDTRKQKLFNLLYQTNGSLTINEYSNNVFWSSRQINRYFHDRFGLSLKAYCKILRCFASYKDIKKGQFFPQQNYYDQSHFIKEIKQLTGASPTELYKNKNDRFLQLATITEK